MNPPSSPSPQQSPLVRMRATLPQLAPAEHRVISLALQDPNAAAAMKISDLARACRTSETTVVRAARAVGFSGYSQLRLALASAAGADRAEPSGPTTSDIAANDTAAEIIAKVAYADAHAITDTASQLSDVALAEAAQAILTAGRSAIFGLGASGIVASDLAQKLLRIGHQVHQSTDPHAAMTSLALFDPRDVAIAFSHSGETREVLDFLELARSTKVRTVVVTNFPGASATGLADIVLTTAARETTFRSGATASRIAQLTVVDMLFSAVAQGQRDAALKALAITRDAVRARRRR